MRRSAGSVPDTSEGQSNLTRLFANGTAENRAVTEGKGSSSGLPRLLADAQVTILHPFWMLAVSLLSA